MILPFPPAPEFRRQIAVRLFGIVLFVKSCTSTAGYHTVVTKYTSLHHEFQELLNTTTSFLIQTAAANFCLFQNVKTGSGTHTASYSKFNEGFCPRR
jgi:hypothetical protein